MSNRATAFADWQFVDPYEQPDSTESLLARLREFCLPGEENAVRRIREVKITEKGEMRTSPQTRWLAFTAEQTILATQSGFCWNAHLKVAKILPVTITDAYQQGTADCWPGWGRLQHKAFLDPMPISASCNVTWRL